MFTQELVLLTWFWVYMVKGAYLHIFLCSVQFLPIYRGTEILTVPRFVCILFSLLILPQLCGAEKSTMLLIHLIASALISSAFLICLWCVFTLSCWLFTEILRTFFPLPLSLPLSFFALQMFSNLCSHCCITILYSNIISHLALQWWKWPYEVQGNSGGGNRLAALITECPGSL